ncbi:MAG: YqaJ viral recombinase family protein [Lachnospiraceae bacterium]|nr:YqaJ viral recombinase family protein [Lachnospiraceae bacterium]
MKKVVSTLNLSREEWLRYRKQGIGGSDAGAVCGLNPYSSAIQVFADKTGDMISEYDNEAMRQGRDFEDYVAGRFTEETGKKVRKANFMYMDKKHPFMLADIDRLVTGERAGLECKTVSPYSADKWKDGQIPPHYKIQCYHYMAVLNLDCYYIAALIFGKEFVFHKIERDEEIIQNLRTIEKDFWENHVLKGEPPEPDGSEAASEWIRKAFPEAKQGKVVPLYGFDEKLKRRQEVSELMEKLKIEKEQIEQAVKLYLGEAEEAGSERYRISWKNITSARLDTKRLKQENPDIYRRYSTENVSRRLAIRPV